jgi:hypothetical protein
VRERPLRSRGAALALRLDPGDLAAHFVEELSFSVRWMKPLSKPITASSTSSSHVKPRCWCARQYSSVTVVALISRLSVLMLSTSPAS